MLKLFLRSLLRMTALVALMAHDALANPAGGVVSGGSANIEYSNKNLDVHQSSPRAVIDWNSFDINADESARFHQPSSSAIVLNRVNSVSPSAILGRLSANGNVVLVNPNGVFFGKGSTVDVNRLLVTSADISNSDFINGRMNFNKPGNPEASIVNAGTIAAAPDGLVGLVAPNVINSGVITAQTVNLASGDTVSLDFYGDGLMGVKVSDAVKSQLVENSGTINANGGTIRLTAAAGASIVNSLINVSGVLRANAVGRQNGNIVIYAEGSNAVKDNVAADKGNKPGSSNVVISGTLDASGIAPGQRGGSITVTGDNVLLLDGAVIYASGSDGASNTTTGTAVSAYRGGSAGGDIRIGGDYLGGGTTPAAKNLYVAPGVLVLNDAINTGDAGRTIFWSDGVTQFYGNVYARALGGGQIDSVSWDATSGGNRGDGGFVETSGHEHLDAGGYVNLTASNGMRGTYFLDPADITIYGNFAPNYGTVIQGDAATLASNIKLWLDASDTSKVTLTYKSMGTTASGASGANTITVSANTGLVIGARIRLGGAGAVTTASTLGADTYTITNIAGTTITLSSNLTNNYAGSTIYQGYVSQLTDKSGAGSNATQATPANMPLWIETTSSLGNLPSIYFSHANNSYLSATVGLNTTAGNYNTIINTMRWSGANPAMPYGFGTNVDIYFSGGFAGFNTGGGDIRGINSAVFSGVWNLLASIFYNGTTANAQMYLNSKAQAISCLMGACGGTQNISTSMRISGWPSGGAYAFDGNQSEWLAYNTGLSTNASHLLAQYQSTKWGIALNPLNNGHSEVVQATTDGAYSVFTTRYLERLSQSANVSLQATNNINLDLQGDTLNFSTAGRSLTINAGNQITTASAGTITTNGGNINLTGTNGIVFNNAFTLNSGGGIITLNNATTINAALAVNSSGGAINFTSTVDGAHNLTVNSGTGTTTFNGAIGSSTPIATLNITGPATVDGNISTNNAAIIFNNAVTLGANSIWNAGTNAITFGSTLDGGYDFTGAADSFSFAGAIGQNTSLGAVSLSSVNALTLPSIFASSISAGTNAGSISGAGGLMTNGGVLSLTANGAGSDLDLSAIGIITNNGNVTLAAGRDILLNTSINTGSGDFTVNAGRDIAVTKNDLTTGLVGYWSFNEGSGTTANDSSGNGNTGTLTNGPTWSASNPYVLAGNNSVNLDGVNDYVGLTSNPITGSSAFTLSAWINSATVSKYSGALSLGGSALGINAYIGTVHTAQVGTSDSLGGGFYGYNIGSGLKSANQWNYVTMTFSGGAGGTAKLYVNGVLTQTTTYTPNISASYASIGRIGTDTIYNFQGLVDDARIYNIALSTTQISQLYAPQVAWGTGTTSFTVGRNVSLDLGGDTITAAAGKSINITAGGNISTASAGTITATKNAGVGGNVTMSASGTGTIDVSNIIINANSGGAISLTSPGAITLGDMNADSIIVQTTGASSDVTIPGGKVLSAAGLNTAITIASGRNFINNAGAGALSAPSGRWMAYSTNPANDTIGGLANDFRRFSCTYGGACPSFPATGNGLLYSYTPTLAATPSGIALAYGDAVPSLTGYAYNLSGYLGSDSGADSLSGSISGTTTYTQGSSIGSYNVDYSSGSLSSAMGYNFTYANNATAITVGARPITVTADAQTATYGDVMGALTYQISSGSLYGTDSLSGVLATAHGGMGTVMVHTNGFDVSGSPFAITQGSLSADSNYALTYVSNSLNISAKTIAVTADDKTKTSGDVDPLFTYSYSGLAGGDDASIFSGSLIRSLGESAGNYAITQGTLSTNGNYTIAIFNPGMFTIYRDNVIVVPDTVQMVSQNSAYSAGYILSEVEHGYSGQVAGGNYSGNIRTKPVETNQEEVDYKYHMKRLDLINIKIDRRLARMLGLSYYNQPDASWPADNTIGPL